MTQGFKVIEGTEHAHPADHKDIGATDRGKSVSVTLILRRRAGKKPLGIEDFARSAAASSPDERTSLRETIVAVG